MAAVFMEKDEEFVGIIGLTVDNDEATIQHIAIIPSYHGEGITAAMLEELHALGIYTKLHYNDTTAPFLTNHLSEH